MAQMFGLDTPGKSHEVPCLTMPQIIRRSGLTHIDFWSLDVEGSELMVLSTMDWASIPVHYVLVETWEGRDEKYALICNIFAKQGGWVNNKTVSTSYCIPHRDCASNTLFTNTRYEAQVAALLRG